MLYVADRWSDLENIQSVSKKQQSVAINWERQHGAAQSGNLQAWRHRRDDRPRKTSSPETKKWEFFHDQSKTEQEYRLASRFALPLTDGDGAGSAPAGAQPSQPRCTFPGQKYRRESFPCAIQLLWSDHPWVGRLQSVEAMLVAALRLCHL